MSLFSKVVDQQSLPAHKARIDIPSPLSGQIHSLESVNNALFSQSLFGDGVAIDASGYRLIAPFDCVVTECPATAHRLRLKDKNGVRLQIQFGIGAEKLYGAGFKAKVETGQKVKQGTLLIEFDSRKLKNQLECSWFLVTVLNSSKMKAVTLRQGKVQGIEDTLMSLYF